MDSIYWAMILLGTGLLVISLELFVPSAGLLGFVAAILIISSVIAAFMSSLTAGLIFLAVTAVALPVVITMMIKVWPNTPIGRRVLIGRMREEEVIPTGEHYDELKSLVGKRGKAKSKMLPSGVVIIEGRQYDAVSEGFAIEPGEAIEVAAVRMNKIFVRKFDPAVDRDSSSLEDEDILSKPIDDVFGS